MIRSSRSPKSYKILLREEPSIERIGVTMGGVPMRLLARASGLGEPRRPFLRKDMESENLLLIKYNKLPEWLRWILFLPISLISSIIIWFVINSSAGYAAFGDAGTGVIGEILHPVIVQALFLWFVFATVPRWKIKWVKFLIIIRSLLLVGLIMSPILLFLCMKLQIDIDTSHPPYDWGFFRMLTGEIITLLISIEIFEILKNNE